MKEILKISMIFLRADDHDNSDDYLFEIPFTWTREQVLKHFGSPSKSGGKTSHPILGKFGAWDRFSLPNYTIHFEFRVDRDAIKGITLMRNDVVP